MTAIPEAAVAFVADLQRTNDITSVDFAVGEWLFTVLGDGTRDEVFEAVTALMTRYEPSHRAFQIGHDVWLLLGGTAVAA